MIDQERRVAALKEQADALADKIVALNKMAGSDSRLKATVSSVIMQMLRAEHVYISDKDVQRYKAINTATLNPKHLLTSMPGNVGDDRQETFKAIFANSFGPWNADFYFSPECRYRILWMLKEPYITLQSWEKGDCGGHDQAQENKHYEKIDNATLSTIVTVSKSILHHLLNEDLSEDKVMDHICILEANHFPGMAFGGTTTNDSIIGKDWIKGINAERLLPALIDYYSPTVILGPRNTLVYTTSYGHFFNWIRKNTYNPDHLRPFPFESDGYGDHLDEEQFVLDRKIVNTGNKRLYKKEDIQEYNKEKNDSASNYMSAALDEKGTLWVAWYHPANFGKWSYTIINGLAEFILHVLS